jgi:hypothetical protein
MAMRKQRVRWIACSLACAALGSCTHLEDKSAPDPLRQTVNQQDMTAPVVPAEPPPPPAAAPKPASAVGPSNAHLAAGLRTSQADNKLDIGSAPPANQTAEVAMPVQRVSAVRQTAWTGNHMSWEQARGQLQARGVNWMQLELHEGMWHLQCSIPDIQDPQKARFFEAHAKDEVEAMRGVLEKMESGR